MIKSVIAVSLLMFTAPCLPASAADMLKTSYGNYPPPPIAERHIHTSQCEALHVYYRAPYVPRKETVTICYAEPVDLRPPRPLG